MSEDLGGMRGRPCPRHEDVLIAIDQAFGRDGTAAVDGALDELAGLLPAAAVGEDPLHELACVAGVIHHRFVADEDGPLSLSETLAGGGGHPLILAGAALAAAHRRFLRIALVGQARRVWLAHAAATTPHVVDPRDAATTFDGRTLGIDLRWRCAHELGGLVISAIRERAERQGDLTTALRAAELRLDLPLSETAARADRRHLQRLRARLN